MNTHVKISEGCNLMILFFASNGRYFFYIPRLLLFHKLNDSDAFVYAGWHGEAMRPDLQAHQNSHCSRGNNSESICAWSWLQNNYFAVTPLTIPLFPSSLSRWGMSGELRPLESEACTPELVPNSEFRPQKKTFPESPSVCTSKANQAPRTGLSLCQLNLH